MMITSIHNKTIKELMKLKQKKYRQQYYLVESMHLVEEAVRTHQADLVISTAPVDMGVENLLVSKEVMAKLAFTKTPQPIMARCRIQKNNELIMGNRYLLLDNLQDPGNIGTLVRTALAFGIDQIILSKQCVDLYNDKLLRSMQGAHFHISCIYRDLEEVIVQLQQNGVTVIGSALENGKEIDMIAKRKKLAFILGNEGNGMDHKLLALCDEVAYIPISTIESLNVAVAGSIMMYHFR